MFSILRIMSLEAMPMYKFSKELNAVCLNKYIQKNQKYEKKMVHNDLRQNIFQQTSYRLE